MKKWLIMGRKSRNRNIIVIDKLVISEELADEFFACDIAACKGACCVEGDLGAPLEKEELPILKRIYEAVEPYMAEKGKQAVAEQGEYVYDFTGDYSTPLVEGRECAYVNFSEEGIALCAIEQAWIDKKIDFQKPISCHLYPVRVSKSKKMEALNYDRWEICHAACHKGLANGIRVYEFVKSALIRKYGKEFYKTLDKLIRKKLIEEKVDED